MNNPASNFEATPAGGVCIGGDPTCPCQDGDVCHYVDDPVTKTAAMDSQLPEQPKRAERDLVLDAVMDLTNAINKLTDARSMLHEKLAAIDYVEPPTESVGEIPEGIFDVFQADTSVIVKSVDEYSCNVLWGPLEFRFKKTEAKDGTLFWVWDEIVGTCWMHIEQMDINYYWMGLTLEDGHSANIHIGAKRAQVDMHGFVESA